MGVDGEYARLEEPNRAEAPFCGGRSVYQNGNFYLYKPDVWTPNSAADYGWVVSDREGMEGCLLESAGRVRGGVWLLLHCPHLRADQVSDAHADALAHRVPDQCADGSYLQ